MDAFFSIWTMDLLFTTCAVCRATIIPCFEFYLVIYGIHFGALLIAAQPDNSHPPRRVVRRPARIVAGLFCFVCAYISALDLVHLFLASTAFWK